uniref:Uncharacterized protein n=1 Tax=Siphoviridae sp. ctGfF74 TaxID=2826223 RepID=A0A8S5NL05_9CAUD|nr:MAG TPA: hypothetical protein [Siphoviridae sp. ctGfF74]
MKSPRQNRKDIVVSAIIGILFTFLPCWEWTGNFQQFLGSVIFSLFTYLALI